MDKAVRLEAAGGEQSHGKSNIQQERERRVGSGSERTYRPADQTRLGLWGPRRAASGGGKEHQPAAGNLQESHHGSGCSGGLHAGERRRLRAGGGPSAVLRQGQHQAWKQAKLLPQEVQEERLGPGVGLQGAGRATQKTTQVWPRPQYAVGTLHAQIGGRGPGAGTGEWRGGGHDGVEPKPGAQTARPPRP